MTKSALRSTIVIVAVAIGLAFLLNPSPDRHRERISAAVAERNPIAGLFGAGAITALASGYYSLGLASYTKAGDRVVSVGFMGMVFVL